MCYTTCVVSALLWIFFTQTVEGVKGERMRCHRPWDSEYWLSYGPFSEEMLAIMCICTPQRHATRVFLCVFEIFFAQKIDQVKSLKMWCRSHSESQNLKVSLSQKSTQSHNDTGHYSLAKTKLSALLWIFFAQMVEGIKGKLMRCHRLSESEYWPSYLPFSEEMPRIVCVCTTQGNTTRAFLCVFEIFWAQKIEDVKRLKMWCHSHSESHN